MSRARMHLHGPGYAHTYHHTPADTFAPTFLTPHVLASLDVSGQRPRRTQTAVPPHRAGTTSLYQRCSHIALQRPVWLSSRLAGPGTSAWACMCEQDCKDSAEKRLWVRRRPSRRTHRHPGHVRWRKMAPRGPRGRKPVSQTLPRAAATAQSLNHGFRRPSCSSLCGSGVEVGVEASRASEGSACDGGSGPRFKHHGGGVSSRRPRSRPAASQPGCLHFLVPRSRPMCMSDTAAQRQDPAVIFKTDAIGITPLHRVGRFSTRESAGRSAGCKLTFSPDSGGQPPAHRAVLGGAGRERECGGQIQ